MIKMVFVICMWPTNADCKVIVIPTISETIRHCQVGLQHEAVQLSHRFPEWQVRRMKCVEGEDTEI